MKHLLLLAFLFSSQGLFAQGLLNKVKAKAQEKLGSINSPKKSEAPDNSSVEQVADTSVAPKTPEQDLTAYRKFGFVRGSSIIFQDNFEDDEVGDYPKRWNSDAGGEIVKLNKFEGHWLRSEEISNHYADFIKTLPLNFTLEFDIISDAKSAGDYNELVLTLASSKGEKNFSKLKSKINVSGFDIDIDLFKPWISYNSFWNYDDSTNNTYLEILSPSQYDLTSFKPSGNLLHVSIVRQDSRLILYINTTRVFDIRNAFAKNTELNNILINTTSKLEDQSGGLYFSNIIVAETVADTRKDFFVDGKFVTNSILFETNSDKIQPQSLSVITFIADYLKANPTVKLKVVGHTDAVGNDASNMGLSKRRANSVLKELIDIHKIDQARLTADGKGESQPIADNTTSEGRMKNRRVEFIKQ